MMIEAPGFFDLQVNGFSGVDFNGPGLNTEHVVVALDRLRATGVTRCLPTLITSAFGAFADSARTIGRAGHPAVAGIHMEGPYISPEDGARGAHARDGVIAASVDDFRRRQEAADGRIALVTLAPEVDGALTLVEHLVSSGVRVAIGHTMASPRQIRDAIDAGASLATHLGNGCPETLPRHPNHIWELLAADGVLASLIADGHHLPASTLKTMIRAKGIQRTILVSDAIAAAGERPGQYAIGGQACILGEDGRVSLPGTPYLAGSSLTLDRAVANAVRFTGLPIEHVLPMASTIPAAYLGMAPAGIVEAEWDAGACALHIRRVRPS